MNTMFKFNRSPRGSRPNSLERKQLPPPSIDPIQAQKAEASAFDLYALENSLGLGANTVTPDQNETAAPLTAEPEVSDLASTQQNATAQNVLSLDGDPSFKFMTNDLLGNIILNCLGAAKASAHGATIDKEQIQDLCSSYKTYTEANKSYISSQISEALTQYKQQENARHFNTGLTQLTIQPPNAFAKMATLTNDIRLKVVNNTFPSIARQLFSGDEKSISIAEWLTLMNNAQQLCNLAKDEFKSMLLKCSTGGAYTAITELFLSGMSIHDVYSSLQASYEIRKSPFEALSQLMAYKACKNNNLGKVQHDITRLAARASLSMPNDEAKRHFFNINAVQSLIRAMPEYSRSLIANKNQDLYIELRLCPTFNQLCTSIMRYNDAINHDIFLNGKPNNYNNDISVTYDNKVSRDPYREFANTRTSFENKGKPFQNKPRINKTGIKNIGSESKGNDKKDKQKYQGRPQRPNDESSENPNSNGTKKRVCGACGGLGHDVSKGCWSCFDDQGRQLYNTLTSGACNHCQEKFGKDLFHQTKYCPDRKIAHEFYRTKQIRPVGIYRKSHQDMEGSD